MSSNYQQQRYHNNYNNNNNYNGYYNNGGRGRYQGNRNWQRATGTPLPPDPRKNGNYDLKDEDVLSNSVHIVSWIGQRIICFYHAGVFYFGRKAIKLLENQAHFMLPMLEPVTNNYYNQTQPTERYSFGIVPHVGDSEKMVCVGQEEASWLLFNFLATNVRPVTFNENDDLRRRDMFETEDNENNFHDICDGLFNLVFDPESNPDNAFNYPFNNPFNPELRDRIIEMIGQLFSAKLLVVAPWGRDYRRDYRSWTEPLEVGRQMQPQMTRQQQPRGAPADDDDE